MVLYTVLLEQKRRPILKTIVKNSLALLQFLFKKTNLSKKVKKLKFKWNLKQLAKYIITHKVGSRKWKSQYISFISKKPFETAMYFFAKTLNPHPHDDYLSPINKYTVVNSIEIPDNSNVQLLKNQGFKILSWEKLT